jgi:hypothetical protein
VADQGLDIKRRRDRLSGYTATGDEAVDQQNQADDQQDVDETAGGSDDETSQPEEQDNEGNDP